MGKPFKFKTDLGDNCCSSCGKALNPKRTIWLELSIDDGCLYYPDQFPKNHASQGCFEFGSDCAKKVVNGI